MKTALFLLVTLALTAVSQVRAAQDTEDKADCAALASSRTQVGSRATAIIHRDENASRDTAANAHGVEEVRGASNWIRPLLKLGQRSSEGLIVSDSTACRVALNASFGKVTPVAAKGWTTVLVVTW